MLQEIGQEGTHISQGDPLEVLRTHYQLAIHGGLGILRFHLRALRMGHLQLR